MEEMEMEGGVADEEMDGGGGREGWRGSCR